MTRLVLLADLHFGSVPQGLEDLLLNDIIAQEPDAALIAGDLTMRATSSEYAEARRWLDRLPVDRLIVPGNHDIPKFNLVKRFTRPFHSFERIVRKEERAPVSLKRCHIVGLNTVAPWQPHLRWQEGRVRRRTVQTFTQDISRTPQEKLRIVVAHHPFAKVPEVRRARPVRRAISMLDAFHANRVDLVLSGHTHQSFVLPIRDEENHLVAIGAPTALSSRMRGEENGYWLIDIMPDKIVLTRRLREGNAFIAGPEQIFPVRECALHLEAN